MTGHRYRYSAKSLDVGFVYGALGATALPGPVLADPIADRPVLLADYAGCRMYAAAVQPEDLDDARAMTRDAWDLEALARQYRDANDRLQATDADVARHPLVGSEPVARALPLAARSPALRSGPDPGAAAGPLASTGFVEALTG